ncbi:hypothetical protein [Streptomyces sp. NBC_01615]|uniref:hypothetical protein n=1 Tax=Streptomyces sp. NBC_01615 TaxID=2975898 RepID=UPI0038660F08
MTVRSDRTQEPLVSLRSAVILILAAQVAALAAVLTVLTGTGWPAAALGAGAAFAGTVAFARSVIG